MTGPQPYDTELDERGRVCPLPVIALARVVAGLAAGSVVRLLADDPAAASDVAAWCRMRGHTLLLADNDTFLVRVEAGPAAAGQP